MAETYTSYGFKAFEVEIDHTVQKRVVFAVAHANFPKGLAWYVFAENLGDFEIKKFERAPKPKTPPDQGWDRINVFGSSLPAGGPKLFNMQHYVNINQFAGSGKFGGPPRFMSTLLLWKEGEVIQANIRILVGARVLPNGARAEIANLVLRFQSQHRSLNDVYEGHGERRLGQVWLLGSTPFTAGAFARGPVSTTAAGNVSAFTRRLY